MPTVPLPSSRLAQALGKPARSWTALDLVEYAADAGIALVSLMHVGSDSWLKTLDFAPRDLAHLRDILAAGERCDGSSLFKHMGIPTRASDITIRPRLDTAFLDPFSPVPTLALLCSHFGRDGELLPESPDTMVRRAYQRVRDQVGVELMALAEVEFFLGKPAEEVDLENMADNGYHATSPFVFGEALRREACVILAQMGVPVKYAHSEVGHIAADDASPFVYEQHEIELSLAPLPAAAEATALTAWVLRNLARKRGYRISLSPVVREGHAGSGLHFHLSPTVDGRHLGGVGPDGSLDDEARWLVAGLVRTGGALMAFGNRSPESFVRLQQGMEAPNTVTWGRFNRKALVRLPTIARDQAGRAVTPPTIEFRLPDGSGHAHLVLAGTAQAYVAAQQAGDVHELLERTRADSTSTGAGAVPRSFAEVADQVEAQRGVLAAGGVFPDHVIDRVIEDLRRG